MVSGGGAPRRSVRRELLDAGVGCRPRAALEFDAGPDVAATGQIPLSPHVSVARSW